MWPNQCYQPCGKRFVLRVGVDLRLLVLEHVHAHILNSFRCKCENISGFRMAGMWITRLGIKGHEVNNQAKGEVLPGQTILRREIWSSLPDDVLDRVIARLPLQYLIRMQSVCKKNGKSSSERRVSFVSAKPSPRPPLRSGSSPLANRRWALSASPMTCSYRNGTVSL